MSALLTRYEGGPFDGYTVPELRPMGRNVAVVCTNALRTGETNERSDLRMGTYVFSHAVLGTDGGQTNVFAWKGVAP